MHDDDWAFDDLDALLDEEQAMADEFGESGEEQGKLACTLYQNAGLNPFRLQT